MSPVTVVKTDPYKLLAPLYERYHDQATQRLLMQWVLKTLPLGRVADCGGGTGIVGRFLAHHGYDVTLLDRSAAMLEEARQRADEEEVSLTLRVHDIQEPFGDTFDHAIALMDVMNHLDTEKDVARFFDTVADHLKPQGYFIFDTLKCSYLQSLDGYIETFPEHPPLTWRARLVDSCRIEHTFTRGSQNASLIEQAYEPSIIEGWFTPKFTLNKQIEHDDRWIYILQKKNTP